MTATNTPGHAAAPVSGPASARNTRTLTQVWTQNETRLTSNFTDSCRRCSTNASPDPNSRASISATGDRANSPITKGTVLSVIDTASRRCSR